MGMSLTHALTRPKQAYSCTILIELFLPTSKIWRGARVRSQGAQGDSNKPFGITKF